MAKKKAPPKKVTLQEYCRIINRSYRTIIEQVNRGIFDGAMRKVNGKWQVDVEKANRARELHLNKVAIAGAHATKRKYHGDFEPEPKSKATLEQKKQTIETAGIQVLPLHEAQALDKYYSAALKKIELELKQGEVVLVDEVKRAQFEIFRQLRDQLLNIPNRVAAILAAETDKQQCEAIVDTEIRQTLENAIK